MAACADHGTLLEPSAPRAGLRAEVSQAAGAPGPLVSGLGGEVCADVAGAARAPGAALVAWACHGGENQRFALDSAGRLAAYAGALCVDVAGARAADGDPVILYPCHAGANQRWQATAAGELRTAVNGKCLDVAGARPGGRLIVYACHGGANQRWAAPAPAAPVAPAAPAPAPAAPIAPPARTDSIAMPMGGAGNAARAELPRATVDTRMPAVTGRTIAVPAGGDLQAALNAARPGDVVTLASGATYVGNFVLPAKAGSTVASGGWVTVRPAADVALPAEGTRLLPGRNAGALPRIVSNNVEPALQTAAGAAGWRLIGLDVTVAAARTLNYGLLLLGEGNETSLGQLPGRIVLDRMYVHGHPQLHLKRCITLNSQATAVVDSYVSECHGKGQETQGILGYNGPGPFRIENNYIEASGIGVLFGGADAQIKGLVPSDIEVRRNHFFKPPAWRGVWTVKNALECKTCQRLLAEGNVFENNWADAQTGFILLFQGLTDDNTAPWARIADLTIRNNLIRNAPGGLNLLSRVAYGSPGVLPTNPGQRIVLENNVFDRIGTEGGHGRLMQIMGDLKDVTIANNTATAGHSPMFFVPDARLSAERLVVRDNVFARGWWGLWTDELGEGNTGLLRYAPDVVFRGNVIYGNNNGPANPGRYPTGNSFPVSPTADGLGPASLGAFGMIEAGSVPAQFARLTTNGRAPGADFASVARAISGVVTR